MTPEAVTIPDDELVSTYEQVHAAYLVYAKMIEQRRQRPGTDIASALLAITEEDGRAALTNDQVLGHMLGLVAAGTDTTALLITNMVRLFTQHPDQLQLVLDDPELWQNAVREGLRRSGVSMHSFRINLRATEIAGVKISPGSNVAVSIASANADPAKFPDPLRFDVRRENASDHLGLGRGRHYCLGAPLVIPEARIALETLYQRLPNLTADLDQRLEFKPSLDARALVSQQVSW
jgi:cytochrome P450